MHISLLKKIKADYAYVGLIFDTHQLIISPFKDQSIILLQ